MEGYFPFLDALEDAGSHFVESFRDFVIVLGVYLDEVDSIIFCEGFTLREGDNSLFF